MKIGVCFVATGRYNEFVVPLWNSVKEFFLPEHERSLFLFTDRPESAPSDCVVSSVVHEVWPMPSLHRYRNVLKLRDRLSTLDYIFLLDADVRFTNHVGEEVFGDLTAVVHPCFADAGPEEFTYERRGESSAFVKPGDGRFYFCGAFQGGRSGEYLDAISSMAQSVDLDDSNGIEAVWHAESHWNRFLVQHLPSVILPPVFCCPEEWEVPYVPKLRLVKKDHAAFRLAKSDADLDGANQFSAPDYDDCPQIEDKLQQLFGAMPSCVFVDFVDESAESLRNYHSILPKATVVCVRASAVSRTDESNCAAPASFPIADVRKLNEIESIDFLRLGVADRALSDLHALTDVLCRISTIGVPIHDRQQGDAERIGRFLRQRGFTWICDCSVGGSRSPAIQVYARRRITKLIIGALSAVKYYERRENCRSTWMAGLRKHANIDAVFLLGADTTVPLRQGDELRLPCPDPYDTLPQRTRWFCRWALDNTDCEYLFKCDDDTYIAIDRFLAVDLGGRDYVGFDLGGFASGGAGYFLSRRAAQIIADELTEEMGAEDVLVGQKLAAHGITISGDARLLPWRGSGEFPTSGNENVTIHGIGIPSALEVHRAVHGDSGFRIAIPTSNRYANIAQVSLELLDRYWPDHPPIDIIHHESCVPSTKASRQYYAGPQAITSWCDAFEKYLSAVNENEYVLILLDDYALCGQVDANRISQAVRVLDDDAAVAAFYLTWMCLPSSSVYEKCEDVLVYPDWEYTVHLQAGIWRRSSLLRLLRQLPGASCESFETTGSAIQNKSKQRERFLSFKLPTPSEPSLFLDTTEKTFWPIPYHNLVHRGTPDPRHFEFLANEGFASVSVSSR